MLAPSGCARCSGCTCWCQSILVTGFVRATPASRRSTARCWRHAGGPAAALRDTRTHTHTHTLCRWARDCLKWDSEHVLIYGRSIGTGPAIYAAKLGLVSGVVLVSPYTSVREIVQEHVGSVISWLTAGSSDWNSLDMMRDVECPVPKP